MKNCWENLTMISAPTEKGKTMYKWICPVCGERIWNCPYCFRCGTRLEDVKNDKERGN